MATSFTGLSFIIPHRQNDDIQETVASIEVSLSTFHISFEIISVVGNHPTYQRNRAAREAIYSHLYFLDNDSILNTKSIEKLLEILKNKKTNDQVAIIGGPSLLRQPASHFEECIDAIFSSVEVVGKIRARYSKVGEPRLSNDQEMILCNLVIEKNKFTELNQFDIKLYPNEENDLIYRLLSAKDHERKRGKVLYHPDINVHRPQRSSLKDFILQMLQYGRGRAEQTRNNFKSLQPHLLLAIAIPFLVLTNLLLVFITKNSTSTISTTTLGDQSTTQYGYFFFRILPILYLAYTLLILIRTSLKRKKWLVYTPLLVFCCHFFYGLGLLLGLTRKGFKVDKKRTWFKIKKFKSQKAKVSTRHSKNQPG